MAQVLLGPDMNLHDALPRLGLLLACLPSLTSADTPDPLNGLLEGSHWSLLDRSVFDQRDYHHGSLNSAARNAGKPRSERSDLAEEWAYGLMGSYTSGFTRGALGLGLDAHAYLGQELDSGGGRAGKARLLGLDKGGHPKDEFSRAGAAVKLRMGTTVASYGEQRVKTPVFGSSDSRLLPETATGLLVNHQDAAGLKLVGGHFTASTDRNASNHGGGFVVNYSNAAQGDTFDLAGLAYNRHDGFSASLYASRYEDTWHQQYLGSTWTTALDDNRALTLDLNLYRTTDSGRSLSGQIDNLAASLLTCYAHGPHTLSLGYQKIDGDTPFDYVTRGAILIGNAVQLSDFNGPGERSWQVRYDLAMSAFGLPGLTLGAAYVRGSHIDGGHADPGGGYAYLGYGQGGKHWERDLEARYVVQQGAAKGLALSVRHNVHRANAAQAELDANQIRLAAEYPLGGEF